MVYSQLKEIAQMGDFNRISYFCVI